MILREIAWKVSCVSFTVIFLEEETGGTKLKSLVRFFQTLSPVEHQFYDMVMKLMKIILTMPATNAISERSSSALRRMKTWLRSTMNQTRLNWCMVLHIHNDDTHKLNNYCRCRE